MTEPDRPFAAALWMIGSILGFSALAVSGRALAGSLDTFEMMLYRSLIGVLVIVTLASATGRLAEDEAHEVAHDLTYRLVKKAYRL